PRVVQRDLVLVGARGEVELGDEGAVALRAQLRRGARRVPVGGAAELVLEAAHEGRGAVAGGAGGRVGRGGGGGRVGRGDRYVGGRGRRRGGEPDRCRER